QANAVPAPLRPCRGLPGGRAGAGQARQPGCRAPVGERSMRRRLTVLPGALAVLLSVCASAQADIFGGISLVSESPGQQAEYAHDPAMSANGRYVVFDGS